MYYFVCRGQADVLLIDWLRSGIQVARPIEPISRHARGAWPPFAAKVAAMRRQAGAMSPVPRAPPRFRRSQARRRARGPTHRRVQCLDRYLPKCNKIGLARGGAAPRKPDRAAGLRLREAQQLQPLVANLDVGRNRGHQRHPMTARHHLDERGKTRRTEPGRPLTARRGAEAERLIPQAVTFFEQEQRTCGDIARGRPRGFRQRIVRRQRQQEAVREQRHALDLRLVHRQRKHHRVKRAAREFGKEGFSLRLAQIEPQFGVFPAELRQQARQHIRCERRDHAEPQLACEHAAAVPREIDQIARRAEDGNRARGHLGAGLGQRDHALAPLDQRAPEILLELAYLHRERRLADPTRLGGLAEMPGTRERVEVAQLSERRHLHKLCLLRYRIFLTLPYRWARATYGRGGPGPSHRRQTSWHGQLRLSSKSVSASRSTGISRPNSDRYIPAQPRGYPAYAAGRDGSADIRSIAQSHRLPAQSGDDAAVTAASCRAAAEWLCGRRARPPTSARADRGNTARPARCGRRARPCRCRAAPRSGRWAYRHRYSTAWSNPWRSARSSARRRDRCRG